MSRAGSRPGPASLPAPHPPTHVSRSRLRPFSRADTLGAGRFLCADLIRCTVYGNRSRGYSACCKPTMARFLGRVSTPSGSASFLDPVVRAETALRTMDILLYKLRVTCASWRPKAFSPHACGDRCPAPPRRRTYRERRPARPTSTSEIRTACRFCIAWEFDGAGSSRPVRSATAYFPRRFQPGVPSRTHRRRYPASRRRPGIPPE